MQFSWLSPSTHICNLTKDANAFLKKCHIHLKWNEHCQSLRTVIIQVHFSCFQYWRSASISICKLNVNQNCTVILLAGEDDPVAELEGSSELLGSEHKTKQNELNFTLHWERKKTNISLRRLSKPSIGQHSVDSCLSVVWILVKHQSNFDWDWWASVDMFTVTQLKHIWPIDQYPANTWPTHDYILNQQSANISAMHPFTFRQYRADTCPTYHPSVGLSVISVDRHYLQ